MSDHTPDHRRLCHRGALRPVAVVLAAVVLGACSGSDTATSASRRTPPATSTTTVATTSTTASATAPVGSAGCAAAARPAVAAEKRSLTVDGADRWFLLTAPASSTGATPVPLVFDFHGLAEGADVHTKMSGFGKLGEADGFAVAVPNGTGTPLHWDAAPGSSPNHDLAFLTMMLDTIEAERCIDTSRVYATGLSYGAIFSSFLVCTMADRFAAVAPVAGISMPASCTPSRPVPVLSFHGTQDPILRFNGGVGDIAGLIASGGTSGPSTTVAVDLAGAGYPANAASWAARNGCGSAFTDTQASPHVIRRVWPCPAGADVELDIVVDGGHAWPGSEFSRSIAPIVGFTTFEIDATAAIWAFFQRFHL